MIWQVLAVIALAVTLVACLPLSVKGIYDAGGFTAKLYIGPFPYTLYPRDKKDKKEKPEKTTEKPIVKEEGQSSEKVKKGGSAQTLKLLLKQLPNFLSDFRRKLRIKNIRLHYVMAGGDPADMALNYGKAWAAIGNLWPYLERFFIIEKRDVSASCDFEGTEPTVYAQLHISITVGRVIALACKYGWRLLKNMKFSEGGAKNE